MLEKYNLTNGKIEGLINKEIEKVIPRDNNLQNLNGAIWYQLDSGGKKIRPMLALYSCKLFGGDMKKTIPFSASCELLHNWLLVHDDIEDQDVVRRNLPCVWVKYGIAHGINVGDYMAQAVYKLILNSKDLDDNVKIKLVDKMIYTSSQTIIGQAKEIEFRRNNNPKEEEYFDVIKHKTAYYLTIPFIGGAIIANADKKVIDSLVKYGEHIGPAFQIVDDILDLREGKGRNEIGCDIKEGKRSILVIHCSKNCNLDEKTSLFSILNKERKSTTKEDIKYVLKLFDKYRSIDYALEVAQELISKAKEEISWLNKKQVEFFSDVADFIVNRNS